MKSKKTLTGCLALRSISHGELLFGYIASHRHSSLSPLQTQLWNLVSETAVERTRWLLPTNLNVISAELGELVGSVDSLLNNNTLFPVFSRFLSLDDRARLRQHHLYARVQGITSTLGLTGTRNTTRWRFATCQKCLIEDIAVDGRPFWRRDFFLPGVEYCSKHEERLHPVCSICPPYRRSTGMTYPGIKCTCTQRMPHTGAPLTPAEVDSEIDISRGLSRLLDSNFLPNVGQQDVASLIQVQATSLGLIKYGRVQRKRLVEFLEDSKSSHLLTHKYSYDIKTRSLAQVLAGKTSLRNPVSIIALLRSLHGSWDAVEEALAKQCSIEVAPKLKPEISLSVNKEGKLRKPISRGQSLYPVQVEAIFQRHINSYRALRKSFPDNSHSQLLYRMPCSAKAFTRKRLEQANEDVPSEPGHGYYASLDQSLAQHIRQSHKLLTDAGYDSRLSRTLLLKGHRVEANWRKYEHRLSEAKVALAECEESYADFRRRRLRQFVAMGRVPSVPPGKAELVETLDDTLVKKLLTRAWEN